jgi:hypothetical protein
MKSNQSISAGNFDTFTLFPKLPPELRLKIWKIAAFAPRAFTIRVKGLNPTIKSQQKLPLLMRVNHEAREAGADMMQCRKLSFVTLRKGPVHLSVKKDIVLFQNFDFDYVFFISHHNDYSSFRDGLKLVENLALCGRTHLHLKALDFTDFFKLLPSLKTLVVYRCETIRKEQQMMMQRSGRVENWMAKRGGHYLIQSQLQDCWEALRKNDPSFQAPAVTFMELGDIEALKSSPENWPMLR